MAETTRARAMNPCLGHSGICANIENLDNEIKQEKADRVTDRTEIWKAIDSMRGWVVAGMGTVVLAMGTFIINNISSWINP